MSHARQTQWPITGEQDDQNKHFTLQMHNNAQANYQLADNWHLKKGRLSVNHLSYLFRDLDLYELKFTNMTLLSCRTTFSFSKMLKTAAKLTRKQR